MRNAGPGRRDHPGGIIGPKNSRKLTDRIGTYGELQRFNLGNSADTYKYF